MLNVSVLEQIKSIPDVTERSTKILQELQPVLRNIMNTFIEKYQTQSTLLSKLKFHTYETTLKTTIADSKNPKYMERTKNWGNKGFVELSIPGYLDTYLVALRFEVNLLASEVHISICTPVHPFKINLATSHRGKLEEMLKQTPIDIEMFSVEDEKQSYEFANFMTSIEEFQKQKRNPTICFGKTYPFEQLKFKSQDELLADLWNVYSSTSAIREFLMDEAKQHAESIHFFNAFTNNTNGFTIDLFNKILQVQIDEGHKKIKTNEYVQTFSILDNNQLITTGQFMFLHRHPKEVIGVAIHNKGFIYSNIRDIANAEVTEWYNKKSFYFRGMENNKELNQKYQQETVKHFREHGFTLNQNEAFYVGTYHNETHTFTEPIEEIKKRLVIASAICAEVIKHVIFPKLEQNAVMDDEIEVEGEYEANFDFQNILDAVEESALTFSQDIIRDFYLNLTSLPDKHFVILNGISGTGKTQLTKLFANAVYGKDYEANNDYFKIIPVRPDWMDGTALFGYYSSFEKRYVKTEFLNMLLKATEERDKPHFVVLDEMNLARVEYYLSDYLSGVESRKPILLHQTDDETVPQEIEIPHNFYLIGTINTDETTHSISDKVLDRAFVMTLSDVDFESFWGSFDEKVKELLQDEWSKLLDLHATLQPYELHFGYRTMNEMLQKLYKNKTLQPKMLQFSPGEALDRVISEKVLPRIRGDERLESLLESLANLFQAYFGEQSISYGHILRMRKELDRYGATQFWR